jgi:branched-subunit amino acid transport protein AzlD
MILIIIIIRIIPFIVLRVSIKKELVIFKYLSKFLSNVISGVFDWVNGFSK